MWWGSQPDHKGREMMTLWDLVRGVWPKPAAKKPGRDRHQKSASGASTRKPRVTKSEPMQEKYDAVVKEMLAKYGVRVRRWRKAMSGIAWEVVYDNGRVNRLIESPRPKGPMSAAVFLHEIGHHAIGFGVYRPRCLEEYHAWAFSLSQMESLGLNVTDAVRRRMHESLRYAVGKARRRGLRELPSELEAYTKPWKGAGVAGNSRASRDADA